MKRYNLAAAILNEIGGCCGRQNFKNIVSLLHKKAFATIERHIKAIWHQLNAPKFLRKTKKSQFALLFQTRIQPLGSKNIKVYLNIYLYSSSKCMQQLTSILRSTSGNNRQHLYLVRGTRLLLMISHFHENLLVYIIGKKSICQLLCKRILVTCFGSRLSFTHTAERVSCYCTHWRRI